MYFGFNYYKKNNFKILLIIIIIMIMTIIIKLINIIYYQIINKQYVIIKVNKLIIMALFTLNYCISNYFTIIKKIIIENQKSWFNQEDINFN